jgi:tetratricopeptide (TPR) repeat protein
MEFLWRPLAEWAGPGLVPMRDRLIARLRTAAAVGDSQYRPATTVESTVRPQVRAVIQLASMLDQIGRADEAEQLLQQQLATIDPKKGGGWRGIEWFSVAAGIAKARWARGDDAGAIAQYEFIEQRLGNSPYAVNATISRSSLLAFTGRYSEALAAVDGAYARWMSDNREDKVPGSERQFAWIRACALEGLGRHDEAQTAFQPVLADREWRDPDFVIEPDNDLRFRGRLCMKQRDALVGMLSSNLRDDLFTSSLLALQPERRFPHDEAQWTALRTDPGLMKVASERMRVLPPDLIPALNGWRDEKTTAANAAAVSSR